MTLEQAIAPTVGCRLYPDNWRCGMPLLEIGETNQFGIQSAVYYDQVYRVRIEIRSWRIESGKVRVRIYWLGDDEDYSRSTMGWMEVSL